MKLKRVALFFLVGLFLYLGLYTWNLRTGHLDSLASSLGLEFATWVIRPGKWVGDKVDSLVEEYVSLVNVQQENQRLAKEVQRLVLENVALKEKARSALRLERLLGFTPPPGWDFRGARVVGKGMGPAAALRTIVLDQGAFSGVHPDTPVITPEGVVGRVMRVGSTASTVLLAHDPNSRIPVIGEATRTQGIAYGDGPGRDLTINYVNLNAPLEPGEVLVTSGVAGVFPKGLPVAVVTEVERSDISLFLTVKARPLADPDRLEEVLVLQAVRSEGVAPAPSAGPEQTDANATRPEATGSETTGAETAEPETAETAGGR